MSSWASTMNMRLLLSVVGRRECPLAPSVPVHRLYHGSARGGEGRVRSGGRRREAGEGGGRQGKASPALADGAQIKSQQRAIPAHTLDTAADGDDAGIAQDAV